jgi:hypothetical protein
MALGADRENHNPLALPPKVNAVDGPTVVAVTRRDDGCADGLHFPSARDFIFAR